MHHQIMKIKKKRKEDCSYQDKIKKNEHQEPQTSPFILCCIEEEKSLIPPFINLEKTHKQSSIYQSES